MCVALCANRFQPEGVLAFLDLFIVKQGFITLCRREIQTIVDVDRVLARDKYKSSRGQVFENLGAIILPRCLK
jgi:hypothetical protein